MTGSWRYHRFLLGVVGKTAGYAVGDALRNHRRGTFDDEDLERRGRALSAAKSAVPYFYTSVFAKLTCSFISCRYKLCERFWPRASRQGP